MHLQMRGKSRQWRAAGDNAARDNALTPNQHASDMVWSLTAATSHAPEGAGEKLVAATKTGKLHTRSTETSLRLSLEESSAKQERSGRPRATF
jgi:hypothetical protein